MKKLMNPFIIAGLLFTLAIAITLYFSVRGESDGSITAQATTISDQVEPETPKETAAELIDLVTIADPYNDENDSVKFATADDDKFLFLASYKQYTITQNQITLPNTKSDIDADTVSISSGQQMIIAYHFKFLVDSSIVWGENTDPNLTWEKHPDVIFPKAGQTAIVEYRSDDGGVNWVGSVQILPVNE